MIRCIRKLFTLAVVLVLLAAFLLCPSWATLIVVCGISAAAAYELLHTAGKKVPKCVYAATILAAVVLECGCHWADAGDGGNGKMGGGTDGT